MKPQIRTKNYSSEDLRAKNGGIGDFPVRSVARLGSTTPTERCFPMSYNKRPIIEVNSVEAVSNSRDKLRMKTCFAEADVPQADWYKYIFVNGEHRFQDQLAEEESVYNTNNLPYPVLAKRINGFKGKGMVKIDSHEELAQFLEATSDTQLTGYYFEKFHNYAREYRIHCTQDDVFMAWRKLRRADVDANKRWFFNSENCNWVGENHELFDCPSNWEDIIDSCVSAIRAVGLDIGSFDVKVQSASKSLPKYILIEVNSAPALGDTGIRIYKKIIADIITSKYENSK